MYKWKWEGLCDRVKKGETTGLHLWTALTSKVPCRSKAETQR